MIVIITYSKCLDKHIEHTHGDNTFMSILYIAGLMKLVSSRNAAIAVTPIPPPAQQC